MAALMWQRQFPHTSVLSTASISVPQSCSSHVGVFLGSPWTSFVRSKRLLHGSRITRKRGVKLQRTCVIAFLLPVDPWNPNSDSQGIASSLFASSLLPYLGFLYHITKSKTSPKLTLFGFYFLLAFVGATSNSSRSPSSTIFGSAFSQTIDLFTAATAVGIDVLYLYRSNGLLLNRTSNFIFFAQRCIGITKFADKNRCFVQNSLYTSQT